MNKYTTKRSTYPRGICTTCIKYDSDKGRCNVVLPYWAAQVVDYRYYNARQCSSYEEEPLSLQEQTNGDC